MKLIIVGEAGVGKSTYRELLENKDYRQRYVPTLGVENTEVIHRQHIFSIWDTAGAEKFAGLKEGYYIGAEYAIIMISDTRLSYESVDKFKNTINATCGNIPTVIVVNKSELEQSVVNYNNLQRKEQNVILISCRQKSSVYEPLDKIINLKSG